MAPKSGQRIEVIDSHTGGEPTRVVWQGGPDLGQGSMADRLAVLRDRFDHYRSALVNEPRGSDVLVGAWLVAPTQPDCVAGVIFFNNVGYLGMCGHGAIGVVATLAHQGRLQPGTHRLETPAGVVTVTLHENGEVSVANVPSYRLARQVQVRVPDWGPVTGDVAWGGNWFFLVEEHGQSLILANVGPLTGFTSRIRQALSREGITGAGGVEIDHIELFGPPTRPEADSRNFVLCPGLAYDRSPCGTGTSAKLACLAAEGKLAENEVWIQESIVGSTFAGRYQREPGGERILPTITGRAYVTGQATLLLDEQDPFCWGMTPRGDASALCAS